MLDIATELTKEENLVRWVDELYDDDVEATCAMDPSLSRDRLAVVFWSQLCAIFSKEGAASLLHALCERWAAKGLHRPMEKVMEQVMDVLSPNSDSSDSDLNASKYVGDSPQSERHLDCAYSVLPPSKAPKRPARVLCSTGTDERSSKRWKATVTTPFLEIDPCPDSEFFIDQVEVLLDSYDKSADPQNRGFWKDLTIGFR